METMTDSGLGHFNDEESSESILILSIEVAEVAVIEVEVTGIFTELEGLVRQEPVVPPTIQPVVPAIVPAVVPAIVPPIVPAVVPPVVRGHEDYVLSGEYSTPRGPPLLGALAGTRLTLEGSCAMC